MAVPSGALPVNGLCEPGSDTDGALGFCEDDCEKRAKGVTTAKKAQRIPYKETFNEHRIRNLSDAAPPELQGAMRLPVL